MSLINQDIKNFVSGISQQPPTLRDPEQLQEQLNGFSSEANGLQKRPPTLHVAKMGKTSNLQNKPLIHFINRDANEKYLVNFTGTDIEVYDLMGNKKTVKYEGSSKAYILTEKPRYSLKALTIADYTFVSNVNQVVEMENPSSDNLWDYQGLLVNIKSGQYGRTYRIDINGKTEASFETPDGSDKSHSAQIATDYIVGQLADQLESKGYTVIKGSSWLYVNKTETKDEEGNPVQLGPSTTPAQQADRFKALGTPYTYMDLGIVRTVYPQITKDSKGVITIKGITANSDNPPPISPSSYHFITGSAFMKEIERCRTDRWKITEKTIKEKATGNVIPCYYTKQFILTPQYTTNKPISSVTRTLIKSSAVYDGFNNQAAFGIMNVIQKFSNLPASAPDNFTVKVAGEEGSASDDYYIKFNAENQVWEETVRPGLVNKMKASTLPHVLVREADGTFTFREAEWDEREIGDDDSNPEPSFIGQTINDVFYFRNRLGFLSGENVICTRSADFFNFWMTSATEVQDTDPIDLAVSDSRVSTLYHAVPFDAELIVFSEEAQFALRADGVLTPREALLTPPLTHFGCSLKAAPINAGRNIYFTAERSEYTTVREFFTAADNTDSKDAQEITTHVPTYIPNGVYKIIPSSIENILLFLTEGEENAVYVYKYLFIDSVRQQAAWSKWDFQDKIYGGTFLDGYLYIVIDRNGTMCLEKMSFTFNTMDLEEEPYRVLLDSKRAYKIPAEARSVLEEETTVDLKVVYGELYDSTKEYAVVTDDSVYVKADEDGIVRLIGDYTGKTVICGFTYLFKIVLSTPYVKQSTDKGVNALLEGRLQLKQLWFNFADSGYFKVIVDIANKDTYEYINTGRILGTASATLNKMPFSTGQFKVPIQSLNTKCTISVETKEPTPIALIGAGWIGNYVRRTRIF